VRARRGQAAGTGGPCRPSTAGRAPHAAPPCASSKRRKPPTPGLAALATARACVGLAMTSCRAHPHLPSRDLAPGLLECLLHEGPTRPRKVERGKGKRKAHLGDGRTVARTASRPWRAQQGGARLQRWFGEVGGRNRGEKVGDEREKLRVGRLLFSEKSHSRFVLEEAQCFLRVGLAGWRRQALGVRFPRAGVGAWTPARSWATGPRRRARQARTRWERGTRTRPGGRPRGGAGPRQAACSRARWGGGWRDGLARWVGRAWSWAARTRAREGGGAGAGKKAGSWAAVGRAGGGGGRGGRKGAAGPAELGQGGSWAEFCFSFSFLFLTLFYLFQFDTMRKQMIN
jgi:hypothetical protein